MQNTYDVKKLIRYIKAIPIAIALIFSIITTYLVLHNNIQKHQENINSIKSDFIKEQKILMKKEVLRTVKQITYQKNLAESNLKKDIKTRVLTTYNIIENIYRENSQKSKQEIIKMIKDSLRTIRFNDGRGYFFIYTMDGTNILYPINRELEGQNLWNFKDSKGDYSIRKLAHIAKEKGEGFLSWYWYSPKDDQNIDAKMYKKIGYTKYFKELDWFVGTGEYVVEFENKIKENLLKEIQQIRYGKNGFIFINQFDGLTLSDITKTNIGKNRLNLQSSDGTYPLQEIMKIAKGGEGYIEYTSYENPSTGKPAKKLSYIYGYKDWKWQIGAGTYLDGIDEVILKKELEFQEKLYKSIISIVLLSILLTLILIYVMLILLRIIEREFGKYEKSISDYVLENHKKDKLLTEQSKLAAMGEMIANISHQWRQPLSVISTAATGMKMQKEYGCLPDDAFNNSCDAINNNAQYLSNTIEDFKNFIKGEHVNKIFSLSKSIDSFLHLVEGSVKSHEINIILDLESSIEINGHENELVQCLMNIFNNSKDAFTDNKVKDRKFQIKTYKDNNQAVLELRDNAGGIKESIIDKIFEPYFTTKHQSQGTGLGLHMTYNLIVDGMKGTIIAENDKDFSGAKFTIILPLEQEKK